MDDNIETTDGTRIFKDCISLANSGSVGTAFYEPFHFVASDHVTGLKKDGSSQFLYLFLASVLEKQSVNFNFNREINDLRIKKIQIILPITDSGEPDYGAVFQKHDAEEIQAVPRFSVISIHLTFVLFNIP